MMLRNVVLLMGIGVLTLLSYLGWLAWDSEYQTDPRTGASSGPYEAWQVVGLGVCLVILGVVGGWQRLALMTTLVIATVLTIAWSLNSSSEDVTGLWAVGAMSLAVGTTAGVGVVSLLAQMVSTRPRRGASSL